MEDDMADKINPFINIGPGQIIKRNLKAMNWSNTDLAEIIGMSEKSVSQLINNKQSVTVPTARLLAKAFETSPEFWLNLEQNYRLRSKDGGNTEEETEIKAEIRKYMPVLEMKKKGWISCERATKSQINAYQKFWKLTETSFSVYETEGLPFCARQGKTDDQYTKYYSITWFQKARLEAAKIRLRTYSRDKLEDLIGHLPEFTLAPDGVKNFLKELSGCGIKFFLLEHLSKTYLDGASFMDGSNPVLVYTARYDRLDNFWWTVAHEIAHIILHLKTEKDSFIDNLDEGNAGSPKEKEADIYAAKLLRVDDILAAAEPYAKYMTEARLMEIAKSVGIDASVVLGILQHNRVLDYRSLPQFRRTVLDQIPGAYNRNRG
jgi:HTH-type transcriptional regulator / antitoxin HigA